MIVTYIRSSSEGCFRMCGWQYMLQYVLGLESDANFSADRGSLVHKALELLASKKLAIQNGESSFSDIELGKTWENDTFTADIALDEAWHYYTEVADTPHKWTDKDKRDCRKWVYDTMAFNNGAFDPMKRTIIKPEQYFDITFDQPWAAYKYELPNGETLEGQLSIKGTIDLVCAVDGFPNVIEYLDWKTGARKDWSNGDTKSYRKLKSDFQLRLYHYALCQLYPDVDEIFVTIVYIKDGGPYSLPFSRDELPETETLIRNRFEEIKNCDVPTRVMGTPEEFVKTFKHRTSKCKKFCHFGKNNWPGTEQTMCDFLYGELEQKGVDGLMKEYGDMNRVGSYKSGGGRSNRE